MKKKLMMLSIILIMVVTTFYCSNTRAEFTGYSYYFMERTIADDINTYITNVNPETTIYDFIAQIKGKPKDLFKYRVDKITTDKGKTVVEYGTGDRNNLYLIDGDYYSVSEDYNPKKDIIKTGWKADVSYSEYTGDGDKYSDSIQRTIIVYGDINGDGLYSYKDVLRVSKYIDGVEDEEEGEPILESLDNGLWIGDSISVYLNLYNQIEAETGSYVWGQSGWSPSTFKSALVTKKSNLPDEPNYLYIILGNNYACGLTREMEYLQELIFELQEYYPNIPIFMQSPVTHCNSKRPSLGMTYLNNMLEAQEIIRAFCSETEGVYYSYALNGYLDDNNEAIASLTDDGLHPNKTGSELIYSNIKKNLLEDIRKGGTSTSINADKIAEVDITSMVSHGGVGRFTIGSQTATGNTKQYFELAAKSGVFGIEADYAGNMTIYHTGVNGSANVSDLLETCKTYNTLAIFDMKSTSGVGQLLDAIIEADMIKNVVFQGSSGYFSALQKEADARNVELRYWYLCGDASSFSKSTFSNLVEQYNVEAVNLNTTYNGYSNAGNVINTLRSSFPDIAICIYEYSGTRYVQRAIDQYQPNFVMIDGWDGETKE